MTTVIKTTSIASADKSHLLNACIHESPDKNYILSLACGEHEINHQLPVVPNDYDLAQMARFIDMTIPHLCEALNNDAQRAMGHSIMRWADKHITYDVRGKLSAGGVTSDNYYISFEAWLGGDGYIKVQSVLFKNKKKLSRLDSKAFKRWLTNHPNTIVLSMGDNQGYVERAITNQCGLVNHGKCTDNHEHYHLMTVAARLRLKLSQVGDDELLFDKTGVKVTWKHDKQADAA